MSIDLSNLSSAERAAITKRKYTINDFIVAGAAEFSFSGYGTATIQNVVARANRSSATFFTVLERKSRLGLLVIDSTFQMLNNENDQIPDSRTLRLTKTISYLRESFRFYPGIEQAVGSEVNESDQSLRNNMPNVTSAFDTAITDEISNGQLPCDLNVEATTTKTVALTAALASVPSLGKAENVLLNAYLLSLRPDQGE